MAFDDRSLNDYIDVNQRIADFREQYPNGSLQPVDPANPWEQAIVTGTRKDGTEFAATMIVYKAAAYRTPDDPRPGIGVAWEVFPGRTPYTLGSELMNAETSAWGRAIVAALASDSKRGVSSREEVRNRRAEREDGEPGDTPPPPLRQPQPAPSPAQNGRTRTRIPGPDHERLRDGTARGRVEGAQRGPIPPGEDLWAGMPVGEPLGPGMQTEDRPGTIDGRQRSIIQAHFTKLPRDERLGRVSAIVGHPVESVNALSRLEAEKVIKTIQGAGVAS